MRAYRTTVVLVAGLLALGACSTQDKPDPLPTLSFKVTGTCTSEGGTLYGEGDGFTPNGAYVTEVKQPDGSDYPVPEPEGHASPSGTTPNWQWPCFYNGQGDPPGTYTVTITDRETNRKATATFIVGSP